MFKVAIKTSNAAFEGACNESYEVARILRELADRVESNGADVYCLQDANGNSVGSGKFIKRQREAS